MRAESLPFKRASASCSNPMQYLPPGEIKAEVEKAKGFKPKLDYYTIVTTAKVSTHSQKAVQAINSDPNRPFEVRLFTWNKVEELLDDYPEVAEQLGYALVAADTARRWETRLGRIETNIEGVVVAVGRISAPAPRPGQSLPELDDARRLAEQHRYAFAQHVLETLEARSWGDLTPWQKYKVLAGLGFAHFHQGHHRRAADFLIRARPVPAGRRRGLDERGRRLRTAGRPRKRAPSRHGNPKAV